jgi:drug/metabolite transporter (DMT)-like permease
LNKSIKIHGALLAVALIYGSTYSIAKFVMANFMGSSGFILIRVLVATSLYLIAHKLFVKEKIVSWKDYRDLFICGFFGVAFNMLAFFKGLSFTVELNASVLMLNAPVFVLIFSFFLLKDRIRKWQVLGIAIAGIGALLLVGGTAFNFSSETARGDLFITLNAISYAFYLVYVKRLLKKYHVLTIAKYVFLFGTLMIIPFGLPELLETDFSAFTPKAWISVFYVAVFTTFVAYLLNAWAVQNSNPTLAGSYVYLQPVFATSFAALYGAPLTIEKLIFAFLIFAGVYLVTKK